jgi:hypothetical protein
LDAPSLAEEEGGSERQMSRRNEDGDNGEEEVTKFAFSFPSPKRERKPFDEEQVETKRPKSPRRQDAQQEEQHGDVSSDDREDEAIVHHLGQGVCSKSVSDFPAPGGCP